MRPMFGGGTVPRLIDPGSHSVSIILQFSKGYDSRWTGTMPFQLPSLNSTIQDYVVFAELQVLSLII